jgi:hypothetical protein
MVKFLATAPIQSLTIGTAVARHFSHPSLGAHTPYAQPQYYNPNAYQHPSPNPPPYTEYATELNRPQSLRHLGSETSNWATTGADTSRYHGGHSNRQVLSATLPVDDYMRLLSLASIKNITTMRNMPLTIPTRPILPMYLRRLSFPRACPPFPIPHNHPREYTPPLLPLPLHSTTVLFHKRSSTLSRNPMLFSTTSSTSLAVSSSVRRQPSTPTHPHLHDMTEASVYHDIPALIHSNFRRVCLSRRRSAKQ